LSSKLESKAVKAKAFQANLDNYEDVRSKLDGIKNRAVDKKSDKLNIGSSTTTLRSCRPWGILASLFNNAGLTMG
jgi:hypothetical protein